MPEIEINLFGHSFCWNGTEAEAAKVLAKMREQASKLGDADTVLQQTLQQAPAFLKGGPVQQRGTLAAVTAWILQQDSGHPECPGRIIDYLPEYDFEVTISQDAPGEVTAAIEARARDEVGLA